MTTMTGIDLTSRQMACGHRTVVRRLNDYPAFWICQSCGQNFKDLGGPVRNHPVDPPTVDEDGDPCPAA